MVPLIELPGTTYTADSASQFIINGQTLSPNSVITVSGTTISLGPAGSTAVIEGSTQVLGSGPSITPAPHFVLTLGDTSFTANSNSDFIIAGQTLAPGGEITVSGTPIQLASDASAAVVGSSTEPIAMLFPPNPTSEPVEIIPCGTNRNLGSDAPNPTDSFCSSTVNSDNHQGITIDGYTTIASPTRHAGSRPTSGFGAFHALSPFALGALGSLGAAGNALRGLGSSHTSEDFASAADTVATAFSDLSSLGSDLGYLLSPNSVGSLTATQNAGIELHTIITAVDTLGSTPAEVASIESAPEVIAEGDTLTQTIPEIEESVNLLTEQTRGRFSTPSIYAPAGCTSQSPQHVSATSAVKAYLILGLVVYKKTC